MRYSPYYVHSHIENFNGNLATLDISPENRQIDIINDLIALRNQLEKACNNFLNGKSADEVWNDINNPTNSLSGIGLDILRKKNQKFSNLLQETGNFYNLDQISAMFGEEFTNILIKQFGLNDWYREGNIVNLLADTIWENLRWDIEAAIPKHFIADLLTGEWKTSEGKALIAHNNVINFNSEFLYELGRNMWTKTTNQKSTFVSNVKQKMNNSKYAKDAKKESYLDKSIELFRQEFMSEFKKRIDDGSIAYLQEDAEEYLNKFEENLRNNKMVQVVNTSHVSGVLGENYFAAAINAAEIKPGNNSVTITTTGSFSEEEVRNKIFRSDKLSEEDLQKHGWITLDKESFSDILIHYKGKTARAQAKNYTNVYNQILWGNDTVLMQIKTLEDKNILQFLNQIATSGNVLQNFNQEELTYVLANTIWFSQKGGINGEKMTMGEASRLAEELSMAVINFIGVVIDDNYNVIDDLSNIFYILNNAALIPSYQIIDKLIDRLTNKIEGRQTFTLTLNTGSIKYMEKSPKKYYLGKKERFENKGDLIAYGSSQGESIISSTKIEAGRMNLLLDSGGLVPTSYTG